MFKNFDSIIIVNNSIDYRKSPILIKHFNSKIILK